MKLHRLNANSLYNLFIIYHTDHRNEFIHVWYDLIHATNVIFWLSTECQNPKFSQQFHQRRNKFNLHVYVPMHLNSTDVYASQLLPISNSTVHLFSVYFLSDWCFKPSSRILNLCITCTIVILEIQHRSDHMIRPYQKLHQTSKQLNISAWSNYQRFPLIFLSRCVIKTFSEND